MFFSLNSESRLTANGAENLEQIFPAKNGEPPPCCFRLADEIERLLAEDNRTFHHAGGRRNMAAPGVKRAS
jgi:hypothetical protein